MAKSKTLDDISKQLEQQNKKTDQTNDSLNAMVMLLKEESEERKRDRSTKRSEDKFKKDPFHEPEFFTALMRGDLITALFGAVGGITAIIAAIMGVIKWSQTIQEMFDPVNDDLKKSSHNIRKWLASVVLIFKSFEGLHYVFSKTVSAILGIANFFSFGLLSRIAGSESLVGKAVGKISNVIRAIDSWIMKFTRFSIGNILGVVGKFGKILGRVFYVDVALKAIAEGFKKFKKSEGSLVDRIFAGLRTAALKFVEIFINTFIEAVPLAFKGLNWLFDDLLKWGENLDIPLISDALGVIRNIYTWFRDLIASNEELMKFIDVSLKELPGIVTAFVGFFIHVWDELSNNFGKVLGSVMKSLDKNTKTFRKKFMRKIDSILDDIMSFINWVGGGFKSVLNKLGFDTQGRAPWEKEGKKPKERISKKENNRTEEIRTKKTQKDNTERQVGAAATVAMIDTSTQVSNSNNTSVSSTNLAPYMRPDGNDPASIPDLVY